MTPKMSLHSRQELISIMKQNYQQSNWKGKIKALDGLIAATEYQRKYAIKLLNLSAVKNKPITRRIRPLLYNEEIQRALTTVWHAANQICAKRLVPFLPELVRALERYGHLSLPPDVQNRLLSIIEYECCNS